MKQVNLWKIPLRANQTAYENDNSSFWVDRMEGDHSFELVRATVYADQAGTLYLDESDNEGATSSVLTSLSVSASVTAKLPWTTLTKRWYRFRYVNGATAQTKFRATKEVAGEDTVNFLQYCINQSGQAKPRNVLQVGGTNGTYVYALACTADGVLYTIPAAVQYVPDTIVIPMTNADTEYQANLSGNYSKFSISMRENDTPFRLAFVTGKVAGGVAGAPVDPYLLIPAGCGFSETFELGKIYEPGMFSGIDIFVACAVAGKTIQIQTWGSI